MTLLDAIMLGTVQGFTEFLPISSSGHLVLFQRLFGIDKGVLTFDIAVHIATLSAVVAVFRRDLWAMLKNPFSKLPILIVLGTIPAAAMGFAFKDFFTGLYESGRSLGIEFIATGIILIFCERVASRGKKLDTMTALDALIIGTAQGIAILPAVSRSGLTIAGALVRGLDRGFAARFSFILSIPAILGSAMLDIPDMLQASRYTGSMETGIVPLIAGMLCAGFFGFLSIKWMIRILTRGTMLPFAIYVIAIGLLVIAEQLFSGNFFGKLF